MTCDRDTRRHPFALPVYFLVMLAVYCAASLIHFTHNATFIADYPNLPAWLGRAQFHEAWIAIALIGVLGLIIFFGGFQKTGVLILAIYAAIGFDGLEHCTRSPIAAHTLAMNATIGFEVPAATVLLVGTMSTC